MKFETPYPTLGELLREIASILDTRPEDVKESNHPHYRMAPNLDRLASEGDFDYTLISKLIEVVFKPPFEAHPSFLSYSKSFGESLINFYTDLIKKCSVAGFNRNQTLPWLINIYAPFFVFEFITGRQNIYLEELNGHNIFVSDRPFSAALHWLEDICPEFRDFKKTFGHRQHSTDQIKNSKDRYRKWLEGKDLPNATSLWGDDGDLIRFYSRYEISYGMRNIINEMLFFSKALQDIYDKTKNYEFRKTLIAICKGTFCPEPDSIYLLQGLDIEESVILNEIKPLMITNIEIMELLINSKETSQHKDKLLSLIENAEKEIELKEKFNPNWWETSRYHGKWHAFNKKDFALAIPHYIDAVNGAMYSGSENTRIILREAVCICCKAYEDGVRKIEGKNLKSIIKRLKSQGSAFGFYPPWKFDEKDVPEQEIKFMASYFWQYFPESKMFKD